LPDQLLADAVLLLHFAVVVFVVAGLVCIVAGNLLHWAWVNVPWLRVAHLAAIAVVVAESWLGFECPLTTLESWLRARAGGEAYTQGFVEHWVQYLLFYDAPAWVFALAYTGFAALVVWIWWRFPPKFKR
jgi:hypothetical protein